MERFDCTECLRSFGSARSCYQHYYTLHYRVSYDYWNDLIMGGLEPPYSEMEGYWIDREHFKGIKSFGFYRCENKKTWISAHAKKNYRQSCKCCNKFYYPKYLWRNTKPGTVVSKNTKPHESSRCEACLSGHPCT